jgi:hypothetical protein
VLNKGPIYHTGCVYRCMSERKDKKYTTGRCHLKVFTSLAVDYVCNMMVHAQKPDFVFRRNGGVHLNRRGASVLSTNGSRDVRISGSNAGYNILRGSVKGTGYPIHSTTSPSLPLPYVTVCHHISAGLYRVSATEE